MAATNKDLPGSKAPRVVPKGKPGRPKKIAFKCTSCGTDFERQENAFITSSSELFGGNNGYLPICKACLERYYSTKLLPALDYDDKRAMEVMCSICDWYFSEDAYNMAKKKQETQKCGVLSSIYAGCKNLRQIKGKGTTYLDTILQRREAASVITDISEAAGNSLDPDANHIAVDENVIHMFGLGYTPMEYIFLGEQYEDWTTRYESNTKAMEECMKALCVAQLNIRRAQQSGDRKGANDAMKAFQEMLSTAKLSPKQNKQGDITETKTFGTLIREWEDSRPIPEPDPEFKDVDNIRKLVNTWFFGHLAKMFNIKNDYVDEYEAEVAKYTVTPPVYDQEDQNTDAEIDAIFGNAKHVVQGEDGD